MCALKNNVIVKTDFRNYNLFFIFRCCVNLKLTMFCMKINNVLLIVKQIKLFHLFVALYSLFLNFHF